MERDGIKALQGGERVVYVGDEEVVFSDRT